MAGYTRPTFADTGLSPSCDEVLGQRGAPDRHEHTGQRVRSRTQSAQIARRRGHWRGGGAGGVGVWDRSRRGRTQCTAGGRAVDFDTAGYHSSGDSSSRRRTAGRRGCICSSARMRPRRW